MLKIPEAAFDTSSRAKAFTEHMSSSAYISQDPRLEDYWRGIILFGRNVASYKFALAKTLLKLNAPSGQLLKLSDLAPVFSGFVSDHLKHSDKQATSASSQFLNICRQYNKGEVNKDKLVDETVRRGFNNVIDAFHIVNQDETAKRFFIDERTKNSGIRITDEFSKLLTEARSGTLYGEVESRWRLVETAWELGVGRNLLCIDHDLDTEQLFSVNRSMRRTAVTSSRNALNGYQKGKCFYCGADIMQLDNGGDTDVDHFFPHVLKQAGFGPAVDGIWNLVLACQDCNRGADGKFARVPSINLLERLNTRNEFLISSHHPLRETLILQTGVEASVRRSFLSEFHRRSVATLLHTWHPPQRRPPVM
jgi:hypothetical protein